MNYDKVKDDYDLMDAALREVVEQSLRTFVVEYDKQRDSGNNEAHIGIEAFTQDHRVLVHKCDIPKSSVVALLMIINNNNVVTRVYEFSIKDM
jgi:hypothetical protein